MTRPATKAPPRKRAVAVKPSEPNHELDDLQLTEEIVAARAEHATRASLQVLLVAVDGPSFWDTLVAELGDPFKPEEKTA